MSPRVLVSGYYGFGNLGDEALLAVIVARLRARLPGVALEVLSATPEATAARYGVEATPRADVPALRAALARADLLLSGGGGLLQNATSTRSLIYYAGVIRGAIRAGKRAMIFAQSIGPLNLVGRTVVRLACRGVAAATVRDERSRALLARLLPGTEIERTADPVFLYDPPVQPVDLEAQGLALDADPLVVVSVRECEGFDAVARTLAAAVDVLAARYGARVAFLPLGGASDAEASARIIRMARSSPVLLPEAGLDAAAAVIARARAVIGMRLHALILAARLRIPFLAIPYDPKVSALCDDLAYPLGALVDPARRAPQQAAIEADLARLWSAHGDLVAHLDREAAAMRARAERNFVAVGALLDR